MRRPVFRRANTSLSLFPFLAVLICTMGSLIVLLVLVLQQARVQASTESAQPATTNATVSSPAPVVDPEAIVREEKKLREEREDYDWRREQLAVQRANQAEQLANTRLELSHLEDHLRRLEEQAKLITAQLQELENGTTTSEPSDAMRAELARVKAAIESAKREMEIARQQATKKPRSFAIIPYQGPNGTKRRPIYIECSDTGITLHPEGIVFLPQDFSGPLGPGNPLDAALRTVREYLARAGNAQTDGEPYPLLIVRPSGAVAYAAARAAMQSWDDEFGYELIDDEMQLRFPPADPRLEELLFRTIKDARSRQSALAAAMPSRFKGEQQMDSFTTSAPQGHSSLAAERAATGGEGLGGGTGTGRGFGGSATGGSGMNGAGTNGGAFGGSSGGSNGTGTRGGSGTGAGTGLATGSSQNDTTGTPTPLTSRGGTAGNGTASGTTSIGNNNGATGGPGGSAGQPGSPTSGGATGGMAGGYPGGNAMSAPGAMGASDGSANGSPSTTGQMTNGARSSNSSSAGSATSANRQPVSSLARTKGTDWALPKKAQHATGITRPIRVQCFADRLVIMPERGTDARSQSISVRDGHVAGSIDQFVTGVWKRTDDWGLAVAGGYWKPVLKVEVAPGAEAQYEQLEILMRGSGLDVQRR